MVNGTSLKTVLGRWLIVVLVILHSCFTATEIVGSQEPDPSVIWEEITAAAELDRQLFTAVQGPGRLDYVRIEKLLELGANPSYYPKQNNPGFNTSLSAFVFGAAHDIDRGRVPEDRANDVLGLFFESGARIVPTDYRLLHWGIYRSNFSILFLRTLLENGFDPSVLVEGYDMAEAAIMYENHEALSILEEYGAQLPSEYDARRAAFFGAVRRTDLRLIEELLQDGIWPDISNRLGETALINALRFIEYTDDKDRLIRLLVDSGADVNRSATGSVDGLQSPQPLHVAIQSASLFVFGTAWANHAHVKNAEDILKWLVARGAFVSGRTSDGVTPLHIAARLNSTFVAELLIESGCTVSPRDDEGNTPLDFAESAEMIGILIDAGAKDE